MSSFSKLLLANHSFRKVNFNIFFASSNGEQRRKANSRLNVTKKTTTQTRLHHLSIITTKHKESAKENIAERISNFENAKPGTRVSQLSSIGRISLKKTDSKCFEN
jgi:hypothetical protein